MHKRWWPFMAVLLIVVFLGGGFLGSIVTADHQEEVQQAMLNVQTTIAIVNADVGVYEHGVRVNYAAAIIESLADEFVLVSPAMAETGFIEGTFGAVITFPSTVSAQVASFHTPTPQRVQLEFQIHPHLSEQDYIATYLHILNLQMAMNTTLSFVYVHSIYSEFHQAQDQMRQVFYNHQAGIDALEIVSLEHFTASLELDQLPHLPFEPLGFEADGHLLSVEGFASTIAQLYLDSYQAASQSFLEMRSGFFDMTEDIPRLTHDWLLRLEAWAAGWEEHGRQQRNYSMVLRQYHQELDIQQAGLLLFFEDINHYRSYIEAFYEDIFAWYQRLKPYCCTKRSLKHL